MSCVRMVKKIRQVRIVNEILMYFRSRRKSSQDVSLSDYIDTGGDGNALSLMDVVCQEDDLLDRLHGKQQAQALYQQLEQVLTPQEKHVVIHRYGLYGKVPQRQREVAQQLGISRSYISRIEKRALEKLRAALEPKDFAD